MLADNPSLPPFSQEEYERRRRLIRAAMEARGVDCLVIYGGDRAGGTDPGQPNALYLSNFAALSTSYVVFPLKEEPTLIVRFDLHVSNARDVGAIEDVRASGFNVEVGLAKRLQELGLERGRIGLVGSGVVWPTYTLPHEHYEHLRATLPGATFEDASGWYQELRLLKSPEELKVMARAGALTSLAYEELTLSTRRGASHAELRRVVEQAAFRLGGNYTFCLLGSAPMSPPSMVSPDTWQTNRTVEDGHIVLAEVPLGVGAYSAKIMGTYFVGQPTDLYRRLFEAAATAYDAAMAGLKPGMTGRDVKQFLKPIQAAGFTTHGPMVMGWATYNEAPRVGMLEGAHSHFVESPADLDFVFQPGHSIYVVGRAATPELSAGVWVGASCVFTERGLQTLVRCPVSELRVV